MSAAVVPGPAVRQRRGSAGLSGQVLHSRACLGVRLAGPADSTAGSWPILHWRRHATMEAPGRFRHIRCSTRPTYEPFPEGCGVLLALPLFCCSSCLRLESNFRTWLQEAQDAQGISRVQQDSETQRLRLMSSCDTLRWQVSKSNSSRAQFELQRSLRTVVKKA